MHALATPGATTAAAPPPSRTPAPAHRPRSWRWIGHAVRPVTPAPELGNRRPGSGLGTLHHAYSTAEMEIKVKPASGTDPVAILQGDINNLSSLSTTGLTNVRDLSAPTSKPLQSRDFQQLATIDYSADGTSRLGAIPVPRLVYGAAEPLDPSVGLHCVRAKRRRTPSS